MVQLDKAPRPTVDMAARRRKNKRILIGFAIPIAFFVGIGVGGSGDDASATTAGSTPSPTVTVTAAPEPAPTVTETAAAEATVPPACLTALDRADDFGIKAGEGFEITGRAMTAAGDGDLAGVLKASDDLNDFTPEVQDAVNSYKLARDLCKG